MLNRWSGLVAALVVAGISAAAYVLIGPSHETAETQAPVNGSLIGVRSPSSATNPLDLQAGGDGPKPSAFSRPARASDAPIVALPELARDVRRIATARGSGIERAIFVGDDANGTTTCVFLQETPLGRGGGGCNPSRNPFAGSPVMWSSSQYNEDPQKLVIFGVVREGVRALSFAFDGGTRTAVPVTDDGGFIYVVRKPVIEPVDVPKAIIAFASSGRELGRTDLGITFGP